MLIAEIKSHDLITYKLLEDSRVLDKIRAMHKEEVEVAQGIAISKADMTNNRGYFDTDKYYTETFGGNNE